MAKKKADQLVEKVSGLEDPVSLDEQIDKGLTPKKEHSELDQEKNDYAQHPKLAKFKTQQGVIKHD